MSDVVVNSGLWILQLAVLLCWIPLYDVSEAETFSLYPDYFTNPVANSSGNFEYESWIANVGFNNSYANPAKAALYPT